MKKKDLAKLVEVIVKETEEGVEEMWMSTNEAGLTSEMRDKLKCEVLEVLSEMLSETEQQ